MKITCRKKELYMNNQNKSTIMVELRNEYDLEKSLCEVVIKGTQQETEHLIVGVEYELILKKVEVIK